MPLKLSPQVLLYEAGSSPLSGPPEGWVALKQISSTAFGDGTHPTTRLCAGAVDFLCKQQAVPNVLDVGTGTGILARIARARGATFVVGTDIDPGALLAARKNAALDSHSVEVLILDAPPDQWGPRFNLVVANILEDPLKMISGPLSRALVPGGLLIMSGFTPLQIPGLRLTFTECGLTFVNESFLDEWALLMFRR